MQSYYIWIEDFSCAYEQTLEKINKALKEDDFTKRLENFTKDTLVLISKLTGKDKDQVKEIISNKELTDEEFDALIEKGLKDYQEGRVYTPEEVFNDLDKI